MTARPRISTGLTDRADPRKSLVNFDESEILRAMDDMDNNGAMQRALHPDPACLSRIGASFFHTESSPQTMKSNPKPGLRIGASFFRYPKFSTKYEIEPKTRAHPGCGRGARRGREGGLRGVQRYFLCLRPSPQVGRHDLEPRRSERERRPDLAPPAQLGGRA